MARTKKTLPSHPCHRTAGGHKNALIHGARKRAIPPDSWNERDYSHDVHLPVKALRRMRRRGIPQEFAVDRLVTKWGIPKRHVQRLARGVYDGIYS